MLTRHKPLLHLQLLLMLACLALAACGSTLPDGRVLYATPAALPSGVIASAAAETDDDVLTPVAIRLLDGHVAALDVLMIPTRDTNPHHLSHWQRIDGATTALLWRYAGMGRGIELRSQGQAVGLLPGFYDRMTEEERRQDGLGDLRPRPIVVERSDGRTAYMTSITLRMDADLHGQDHVDVRIRRMRGGLCGFTPYDDWRTVPVLVSR